MDRDLFISKLKSIADSGNTVYALGMWGQPITRAIISSKANQLPRWYTARKQAELKQYIGKGVFGFDCVCLIKSILWGFSGDTSKKNGGATYASNNVPDVGADTTISKYCTDVSTDFSTIEVGEAVWLKGHIGVYIGNGVVVECTPKWSNKVQYSNLGNISAYKKGNYRVWTKHGKLKWLDYTSKVAGTTNVTQSTPATTTSTDVDAQIWNGLVKRGFNAFATAGIMGNLKSESALKSTNLQNSGNTRLGISDEEYTSQVDSGKYTNFVRDNIGYGLAQWTYWSRKLALLNYAKKHSKSIGDLEMQLDFLAMELKGYTKVISVLSSAKTVREASNIVLLEFERPANTGSSVQEARYKNAQAFYDKFAGTVTVSKTVDELAREVIAGKWGIGVTRKKLLTEAGYSYSEVQSRVNALLKK